MPYGSLREILGHLMKVRENLCSIISIQLPTTSFSCFPFNNILRVRIIQLEVLKISDAKIWYAPKC